MSLTLQQLFDNAWRVFIIDESPPAVKKAHDTTQASYGCEYLTAEGLRCAIGVSIPDGHPAQQSAGYLSLLVKAYPELFAEDVMTADADNLWKFQRSLHDDLIDLHTGKWRLPLELRKARYIAVAKDFNLTIPSN